MAWFTKGFGGMKKEAQRQASMKNRVSRHWMPAGSDDNPSEREMIFLDDDFFCFYEHNPKLTRNGKTGWKGNWFTCVEGIFKDDPGCEMCRNDVGQYYVGMVTVIDCSEYEYNGKIYKNTRRLFAAKYKTLKRLKEKRRRMEGLAGKRFLVSRSDGDAASVGDDFEFLREEEMVLDEKSQLMVLADHEFWWKDKEQKEHPPMPFDYEKVCAPISNEDLGEILSGGAVDEGEESESADASIDKAMGKDDGGPNTDPNAMGEQSSPDEEAVPY
jgi:hypothetical protein